MARMITHADAEQLLGALALDAVDREERESLELHLETCPRCRAELRNHLEVVGLLAYAGQDAPEGLWDRIVSGLSDEVAGGASSRRQAPAGGNNRPASETAGPPLQVRQLATVGSAKAVSWKARRLRIAAMAAAAGIVVLLGIEVAHLQGRINHLSGQLAAAGSQPTIAQVDRALGVPGARKIVLDSSSGRPELQAVILPGGQGYLYSIDLSPLPPDETYQLWGLSGSQAISYGLVGATPEQVVPFRAAAGVTALAVTAEVAGGVQQSTHKPVAVGVLR